MVAQIEYIWAVVDVSMLDDEHRPKFLKPWLCVAPDATVREFDAEDEACAFQLEQGGELDNAAINPDRQPADVTAIVSGFGQGGAL